MPPEKQMQVLPTTQAVPTTDPAEKMIQAKRRKEAEDQQRVAQERNEKNVTYLLCPRVKGHIAAFLTERPKPRQLITPGHWYSRFHKVGEPYRKPYIQCQECQYDGEQRPWTVQLVAKVRPDMSFDFTIEDAMFRHVVGEMPREQAEKEAVHG